MGYGDEKASDQNIKFAFDTALAAARECWALTNQLRAYHGSIEHWTGNAGQAPDKVAAWTGPKRVQFDEKVRLLGTNTNTLIAGLEQLARDFALQWSRARGQQDRINRARWVDMQQSDDNLLEKGWHLITGDTDHGQPPGDPPVPQPPRFEPTRAPMFDEHRFTC